MWWILLISYLVGFFVVLSKKMEIEFTDTGPATFGQKLFCAVIWPLLAVWIGLHVVSGHCRVKRVGKKKSR